MAIKIECKRCGFKNDLGKVFCGGCGQRLDLDQTALDDLASRAEFDWGRLVRRVVAVLFLTAIIVLVGLALWSPHPPLVESARDGAELVPRKLRGLKTAVRQGASVNGIFLESELNGFLATRAPAVRLKDLWIDLRPGEFELGAAKFLVARTAASGQAQPKLAFTYSLTATFDQNRLAVRRARVGRLPLVGPLAKLPRNWFAEVFPDLLSETNLIAAVKSVRLEEGRAEVIVGR